MTNIGLARRARQAREAHKDLHAAFAHVVNRNDHDDPRTKRWLSAVERFRDLTASVLPAALREVEERKRDIGVLDTADILDFLETDPRFYRSGYVAERLLREIKKRYLDPAQTRCLQDVVLHIARTRDCREYRHYCRAAAAVDDARLRGELGTLQTSPDAAVQRRARWMLEALDQARQSNPG